MPQTVVRDVEYQHRGTRMRGLVITCPGGAAGDSSAAGVLLIHDAFGLGEEMIGNATLLAEAGHPVFLADVWGERATPSSVTEIGPLIGSMTRDRDRWLGRVAAAHAVVDTDPEFTGRPLALLGYCFGGSSALEYLRTGAAVAGVAAVHPGLDLLGQDWSTPGSGSVLLMTGADDPMATPAMRSRLEEHLSSAGLDHQFHVYSGTTHAFTSPKAAASPEPELFAYNARSAARAWAATTGFLAELSAPAS
ncbi:dienelactone hydrolase family protein [Streptomyces castrisilvae]|uniref:Dienelactone hydrolase family protein n=1 Tax=Streptomyces castrisilvae TaxID=3033811 RepID=A0ABY9HCC1_9ACTN|nr:dienelactone hydrolase family protein [Streptomyces sp. Mut1]WLQ31946.1 dienelactone hydrolase family protein [Streptomyces sp. Mut1]